MHWYALRLLLARAYAMTAIVGRLTDARMIIEKVVDAILREFAAPMILTAFSRGESLPFVGASSEREASSVRRPCRGNLDCMAEPRRRKPRRPTRDQRAALANAILLRQYCEALGVEWDGDILRADTWVIEEDRYIALHIKVIEVLFERLGAAAPLRARIYAGVTIPSRDTLDVTLSYKALIDLGHRAGWI
jgi:hypothetical protein